MTDQHLATEYLACQYHIQTIDMRLWQSGAILIGASFASLAVLAREEASTPLCIGVALASLAAITIFGFWTQLWRRRDATVDSLETRMREIESKTSMRKVSYLYILRHWEHRQGTEEWLRLPHDEQANLERLYRPLPSAGASRFLYLAALLALAGWPALSIAKAIELAVAK
jgi:hypothetical protein